jgi:hypothetical protein
MKSCEAGAGSNPLSLNLAGSMPLNAYHRPLSGRLYGDDRFSG